MWIGMLWAGLRAAMWITHVGGKFHHGLLEKSLIVPFLESWPSAMPQQKEINVKSLLFTPQKIP